MNRQRWPREYFHVHELFREHGNSLWTGRCGRRCPGPGLRLAVSRNPIRTAAVLTARLTGGAVSKAGRGLGDWPPSPSPGLPDSESPRRTSESGRS